MAAAMDGMDALVFTGGVGERSPQVRELAARGLSFLGVELDQAANVSGELDRAIGARESAVDVVVATAREDLEIASQTRQVVRGHAP